MQVYARACELNHTRDAMRVTVRSAARTYGTRNAPESSIWTPPRNARGLAVRLLAVVGVCRPDRSRRWHAWTTDRPDVRRPGHHELRGRPAELRFRRPERRQHPDVVGA